MSEEKNLMTTKEVLEMLKISRPKLYKLMYAGKIKPANFNPLNEKQSKLLFARQDVEALLKPPQS